MSTLITLAFVASALQLGAVPAAANGATAGAGFALTTWSSGLSSAAIGVAFRPATGELFVTTENGHLWRVPAAGGGAADLGNIGSKPRGIAFTPSGGLFVAIYGTGSGGTGGKVIEADPATGAILRTVVDRDCAKGLAYDPGTGGLLLTTCGYVRRIVNLATTPVDPFHVGAYDIDAIQVAADGRAFANGRTDATNPCMPICSADRQQIWELHPSSAATVANIAGTTGLTVLGPAVPSTGHPKFIFANTASGAIVKRNTESGATLTAVTGGDAGWYMTLGPDGCLYATHGSDILRLAKADLSCDLVTAGESTASLSLFPSGATPNIGTATTVTATLVGVTTDPGTTGPTFTVSGVNPRSGTGALVSSGGGQAKWAYTYTGTSVGLDTVVATMTYGSALTSNPVTVSWRPPPDATPPVVRAKITSASPPTSPCVVGTSFVDFASPTTCGFYTSPPTVTWQVVDLESPFLDTAPIGCPPFTVDFPASPAGQPVTCSATSQGGSTDKTLVLQVALVEPEITATAFTVDGAYIPGTATRRDVTVTFLCKASYGPPFMTCDVPGATYGPAVSVPLPVPHVAVTATRTFTTDGVFTVTGSVSDPAGRSDAATFGAVRIDKTAPVVTGAAATAPNAAGWHNADVGVSWTCVDGAGPVTTGCAVAAPAAQTVTAEGVSALSKTATDGVGNVGTGALTVRLDKTRPTIVASATANGAPYVPGTLTRFPVVVSYACGDTGGSGLSAPCPSPVTVTADAFTTAPVTVFDNAGNESLPAAFGPTDIDQTAPTITADADRAPNSFGWYDAPVTVDFSCAGTHRGLPDVAVCPPDAVLSADGAGQTATGTAVDDAGNTASATYPGINIDQGDPTIAFTVSPPATAFGWRNQQAVVTFTCADPLSGIADCTAPATLGEGADQTASGTATDRAGNTTSVTATGIDVDLTRPHVAATPDRAPNADGWYGASVTVTFTCGDALSGIDVCPGPATRGHGGAQVVSGTARDKAGNEETASITLDIDTVTPSLGSFVATGDPADGGRFALQAVVTITGADALSGVRTVERRSRTEPYADPGKTTLGPAGPWSAWTLVHGATTTFTWTPEGRTTFEIRVTDRAGNAFTDTREITVVHVIATETLIAQVRTRADGKIEVTAKVRYLFSPAIAVPAGKQVVFGTTAAGAAVTGTTVAGGVATGVLERDPGLYTATASFPQQLPYLTSAASQPGAVAAQATSFAIWGGNTGGVALGSRVQFWGGDWEKQIASERDPSYRAAGSFKGFAESVAGTAWTAKAGSGQWDDDDKVRELRLGSYITVLVTDRISKRGATIAGNVVGYAVLRVEPGRKHPRPGEKAFGIVVAVGP
ncbi:MAG TPA: hypothetical protein VFM93_07820 [Candidatus Limnocylindria bacterium]|nr:hypothetical protein [Candidatus Limnocylindria bacterium]